MTTPHPATQLRAAVDGAVAGRAAVWTLLRRHSSAWLVLPVVVAGWDATRAPSLPFVLAVLLVPLILALARASSLAGAQRQPEGLPRPSLLLVVAVAAVIGGAVLALAGAGPTALVLIVATGLLGTWGVAPAALPTAGRAVVDTLDRLLVPALLAGAAGLSGALLPAASGADPPAGAGVPWAWLLALAGWRAARAAVHEAAAARPAGTSGTPALRPAALGWVVVAGQLLAILAAITQGPLGILAGVALLPGLLLGPMVAAGRGHRALLEATILDRLVLAWIAVLLLAAWGVLPVDPWSTAVAVCAAAAGYLLVAIVLVRILTRRRRPRDADAATLADPSLVIVLPLVHPVTQLRPLILALRSQTYADTRVVVPALPGVDISVVVEWLGEDGVLPVGDPPAGWEPGAWARHVALLDDSADSDMALVVDTRSVLAPVAARVLVEHARATRVDAIGAIPRNVLPSFADRLAGSGPILWRFGWEPRWWVALTRGRPARLVGPDPAMVLVRVQAYRAALERTGGRPVATDGLLRALADDRRRIGLVHAADLATRRGETGVAGAVDWWRSMAVRLSGGTVADTVAMLLLVILGWLAPLALPLVALAEQVEPGLVAASLLPLLLLVLARLALAATQRGSVRAILWHPVTAVVAVLGILSGLVDHATRARDPRAPAGTAAPLAPPDTVMRSPT